MAEQSDFGKGKVYAHIVRLAAPQLVAQVVQMLYSVVDRVCVVTCRVRPRLR